jgi:hypothetical protein
MEESNKTILIMDHENLGSSTLNEAMLREKFGSDLVVLTPQEDLEQGLDVEGVDIKRETKPLLESMIYPLKSGKAKRRERRAAERLSKKRKR